MVDGIRAGVDGGLLGDRVYPAGGDRHAPGRRAPARRRRQPLFALARLLERAHTTTLIYCSIVQLLRNLNIECSSVRVIDELVHYFYCALCFCIYNDWSLLWD